MSYAFAPNSTIETAAAWRAFIWSAYICNLVGQQQVEQDRQPGGGAPFWQRLRDKLPHVLRTSALPGRERAEAGRLLARLDDPRAEVMDVDAMQFCYVSAGSFLIGSPDDDPDANDNEKPLLTLHAQFNHCYTKQCCIKWDRGKSA